VKDFKGDEILKLIKESNNRYISNIRKSIGSFLINFFIELIFTFHLCYELIFYTLVKCIKSSKFYPSSFPSYNWFLSSSITFYSSSIFWEFINFYSYDSLSMSNGYYYSSILRFANRYRWILAKYLVNLINFIFLYF